MPQLAMGAIGAVKGLGSAVAGIGSSASSLLGGSQFFKAVSLLGTIGTGLAANAQAKAQAADIELQAGQEKLRTVQQQTRASRQLRAVLGENANTFAAAGIDLSGGIAQSSADDIKKRAADNLTIDRADDEFRRSLAKLRARNVRAQGRSALLASGINAAGQLGASLAAGNQLGLDAGPADPWAGIR